MTDEQREKNPQWKPNSIPLGGSVEIELDSSKPVASGTSKFGEWEMWTANVKDQVVFDRDKNAELEHYTGKVVFFPSEKLRPKLLQLTGGEKTGIKINLSRIAVDGDRGTPYTEYVIKNDEESLFGSSESKYTDDEKKLLDQARNAKAGGTVMTEELFVSAGSKVGVAEDRAKELFKEM